MTDIVSGDPEHSYLYISKKEVVEQTGLSKARVYSAIKSLEECGIIVKNGKKGDDQAYLIDLYAWEDI